MFHLVSTEGSIHVLTFQGLGPIFPALSHSYIWYFHKYIIFHGI